MSSESRANDYPRASAILGGLSLVTQLAAAATDSVPIAKLVVGIVAQIVKLAEDIEKRRTALHALAETARAIGESIDAVVSHRKPSEQVEGSLKGLLHVFRAIQVLFAKHKAKRPFFRALSYAFTTAGHIDDLTRELSRASQQFTLVAGLDTNARACEAETRLEETNTRLNETNGRLDKVQADIQEFQSQMEMNSYYTGQCRNLHDCDIGNLELIHEQSYYRSRYKIRYYTVDINGVTTAHAGAKNTGTVFVLRSLVRNPDDAVGTTYDDNLLQMISRHDSTLEKLSTPSNRHRNIAYLYGRRMGTQLTSFTVMKSGYISISKIEGRVSIEQTWHLIGQVVDALCHLDERGASWAPKGKEDIFLDESGAPMIGLNNDLRYVKRSRHAVELFILGRLLEASLKGRGEQLRIDSDNQQTLAIRPGGVPVPWSERAWESRVPLRIIPSFNERRSRYLQKALASCRDEWDNTGMLVLLAAASGRTVGSVFLTTYFANSGGVDNMFMCRAEERDEELIFMKTSVDVPVHMKDEFRKTLGITLPDPDSDIEHFISTNDTADLSSMSFILCQHFVNNNRYCY